MKMKEKKDKDLRSRLLSWRSYQCVSREKACNDFIKSWRVGQNYYILQSFVLPSIQPLDAGT